MSTPIHWNLTVLIPTLVDDGKRSAPIDRCLSHVTPETWLHPLDRNAFVAEIPQ